jgi:hypothetical protein
MTRFVENPIEFSADCVRQHGKCEVVLENFLFIDRGNELAAIDRLLRKCGHVVIIPDGPDEAQALLYHTSCQRMTDVVSQIFQDSLGSPASLPQASQEMTVGELFRRKVTLSYGRCREKVEGFASWGSSQE